MDTSNISESYAIRKEKELVWVQILYLYIAPVIFLYFGIIPGTYRIIMLFSIALLMYGIIKRSHWTYGDMGFRKDFWIDSGPYLLFTVCGVGFLLWLSSVVPHEPFLEWWENKKFLLLFVPISVLQEVIFRGILMHMERKVFTNRMFIITLNALVFAFIHVIYLNSIFVLPLTFIGGVAFAWIYYEKPNLILISLAHTVLNFTAMILGFFIVR